MAKSRRTCPNCRKRVRPNEDGVCPVCSRKGAIEEYLAASDSNELFYEAYDLNQARKVEDALPIYEHLAARLAGSRDGELARGYADRIRERLGVPPAALPNKAAVPDRMIVPGQSYKSLAKASMVVGTVSLFPPYLGIVLGVVALVLSISAKNGMKRSGNHDGKGMATTGMVTGIVGILGGVTPVLVFVLVKVWPILKNYFN